MRADLVWFIVLGVIYFIGVITVKYLDKTLSLNRSRYHYLILFIMWVLTPILLVVFILDLGFRFIKKTIYPR